MSYFLKESDLALLKETGLSEPDIAHCVKVAEIALDIAQRTGLQLDFEFVGRGALFHDLGKAQTHDIEHGKIGAELGARLGLPQALLDIMERHVRGGLTADEATELGLPVKDYTLRALEERIVIYADRLVDIITDPKQIVSNELEAEERFEEILTSNIRYGKNAATLARYLDYHREIQWLMKPSTEASELRALLRRDPDAVMVIDVRRRRDFEGDSRLISAAQWRDPEAVDTWSKDLGRDRPVVVYCVRGGSVSQTVSARLAERGVPVKYLEGGLAAWDLSRETI